jgi:hypothetical protein
MTAGPTLTEAALRSAADLFGHVEQARPAYPDIPGSRYLPASREAADKIAPKAADLRTGTFRTLHAHGPLTADEAAEKMDVHILAIRPRFSELYAQGVIEPTGERRKNAMGNNMTVWRIVAANRSEVTP